MGVERFGFDRGFLARPGQKQLFHLERPFVYPKKARVREGTTYRITGLSAESQARLLEFLRAGSGIENGLP